MLNQNELSSASIESLARWILDCHRDIGERIENAAAIATGGVAWMNQCARQCNDDIDVTSRALFRTIDDNLEDAAADNLLKQCAQEILRRFNAKDAGGQPSS
jgi:hypothetical protein